MKSEKMEKTMKNLTLSQAQIGRKAEYIINFRGANNLMSLSTKFWELLSTNCIVKDKRRKSYETRCKQLSHTHMKFAYDQEQNKLRIHFSDSKEDNTIDLSPSKKWTTSISWDWKAPLTASIKRLFNALPSLPELNRKQKMVFKEQFNMEYCLMSKQVTLDLNNVIVEDVQ